MTPRRELGVLLLLAAVQFVNVLEFMMVMPLGPYFLPALGIRPDQLGLVGAAYTITAAAAGLLGARFLDRFDRRSALAFSLIGLLVGTAAGGFARGLVSLLVARALAGAFGGPATTLTMSIVADLIPAERRGRALSLVMTAQSISSVMGLPTALWLAQLGGWRLPFFGVAGFGLVLVAVAVWLLPSFRGHLDIPSYAGPALWRRRTVLFSWTTTAVVMASGFAILPFFPAYLVGNLGFPRERLSLMYLAGGLTSLFILRRVGRAVDRFGSTRIGTVGSLLFALLVALVFGFELRPLPVIAFYVTFAIALSLRNVAYQVLASKVPAAPERAQFQSIQSATQHVAMALGGAIGSALTSTAANGETLVGMPRVAALSVVLCAIVPLLLRRVERGVMRP